MTNASPRGLSPSPGRAEAKHLRQFGARLRAVRAALTPAEWRRFAVMMSAIVAINALGWGTFLLAVQPRHFHYQGLGVGLGVALMAWTLGARHAFDADHISAIDNTTRKLMSDGKRPLGTGFFFALGHSTAIVVVGFGLGIAARAVFGAVVDPNSGYETVGGVVGTSMAAGFLYLIAALNAVVLAGIVKVFRGLRAGRLGDGMWLGGQGRTGRPCPHASEHS
jgi:high-affinity nickel-transport protein